MFQGSASGSASRSASGSASGVPHIPLPFRWWTPQKCIHPDHEWTGIKLLWHTEATRSSTGNAEMIPKAVTVLQ